MTRIEELEDLIIRLSKIDGTINLEHIDLWCELRDEADRIKNGY